MKKVFKSLTGIAFAIVMVLSVSCQNDPKSVSAETLSAYTNLQFDTWYKHESKYPDADGTEHSYIEKFRFSSDLHFESDSGEGSIEGMVTPISYPGIVLLVKMDNHYNYKPMCYPDFNEEAQHKDCYLTVYLAPVNENSIKYSMLYLPFPDTPEGHISCTKDRVSLQSLIKDNLSTICEGNTSSDLSRGLLTKYPKNHLSGIFTVE